MGWLSNRAGLILANQNQKPFDRLEIKPMAVLRWKFHTRDGRGFQRQLPLQHGVQKIA